MLKQTVITFRRAWRDASCASSTVRKNSTKADSIENQSQPLSKNPMAKLSRTGNKVQTRSQHSSKPLLRPSLMIFR